MIGFAVAAIPGAVFIETTRRTLIQGLRSGFLLVFGEFLGHILLFLIIFFGFSEFFKYNLVNAVLYIGGGLLMLWLGYNAFSTSHNYTNKTTSELSKNSSLFIGLGFSISDPYIIGLWIALSGTYLLQFDPLVAVVHILLVSLGFLLFFIPLILLVHYLGRKIPDNYIVWLSRIGGIILIFTACVFLRKFIILFV